MVNRIIFSLSFFLISFLLAGQSEYKNYQEALLSDTPILSDLKELCDQIGGRVTGTEANESAIEWGIRKFNEAGVAVKKESFEMPSKYIPKAAVAKISDAWGIRFSPEVVSKYKSNIGIYNASLVYIETVSDSAFLNQHAEIKNQFIIVDNDLCFDINGLFAEYTYAKRVEDLAIKYEAAGIIFMSSRPTKLLYRFISSTGDKISIPQLVMAREDAKRCIRLLRSGKKLQLELSLDAMIGESYDSHNVIAEIKGKKYPDEVILVGAHLDSWALGTGANDNGCNVAMMIDLARQIKMLGIEPDRTIRFALWNGEEQGYFGSLDYTKKHREELNQHKLAISIDIGSGGILGYFTNGREALIPALDSLLKADTITSHLVHQNIPIIGTDNLDFMFEGVPNLVAIHKPAFYGPNYHASSDTYDKVHELSLKRNAAIVGTTILKYANAPSEIIPNRQNRSEVQAIIDDHELEFTMKMFSVWEDWVQGRRGRF